MLSQQGVQIQPLEITDFSGGMTDNFIGGQKNQFERADNFILRKVGTEGKLFERPGLVVSSTTANRITTTGPTDKRISKLFDLQLELFQCAHEKLYRMPAAYAEVTGPTGNAAFIGAATSPTNYSVTEWNKHALIATESQMQPVKTFKNGSNWYVHQVGLPRLATTPVITGTGVGKTFLYAFNMTYSYVSDGVTFEEQGMTTFSSIISNNNDPAVTNIAFTAIPVLANGASYNYDTANIKINIYRTINGGTAFYYVGQVTNGTTVFTDNVSDTNLQLNTPLYSTGDVPDHEQPPMAKYIHQANDVVAYGAVKEGGVSYNNKVRFSNRFQPWSCPAEFYEEFDEDIQGISSVNTYFIIFGKTKVYRVEGFFFPDGSGGVSKRVISDTAGCVSERSIIKLETGVAWAGNDGFYYTDGTNVIRVSNEINITYKNLTATAAQKARIYGSYDASLQVALWAVQEDAVGTDNDTIYVGHIEFFDGKHLPFTTWSGSSIYASNFAPSAVHFFNNVLYHADYRGYLLEYDDTAFDDIKVDTTLASSAWHTVTIIYRHDSPAFDCGSSAVRKMSSSISVIADNASSISMAMSANNDNSGDFRELGPVLDRSNVAWGDYSVEWGDANLRWNYFPVITFKRRMPKGALRFTYKQIRMTNDYTEILNSSDSGLGTMNGLANTATLAANWPIDVLEYYISTAADNYATEYRITAQSGTTITVEDLAGTFPTGSYAWVINGYRKGEIFKLISYSLNYSFTSQSQTPYKAATA